MDDVEYIVLNETVLGYRQPGAPFIVTLRAQDRDPLSNILYVSPRRDTVRQATQEDFNIFRVCPPPGMFE